MTHPVCTAEMAKSADFGNFLLEKLNSEVWQYGLWGFQMGDTKLERFLPLHTSRINIPEVHYWILSFG